MTWTIRPRSSLGQLAAIAAGAGPKIVLIHGVGLRAEAWGAQIDALSSKYEVLAVDLPGHGDSAALGPLAKLAEYADVIAAAINAPAVVIGHSFGAMIALEIALRHPAKLHAVGALNAIHQRSDAAKAAVLSRANSLDGRTNADPDAPLTRWFGTHPSPERDACHAWLSGVDPSGYRDAYSIFAAHDGPTNEELRGLQCPALFLTGAEEPNSTPAMSRRMAALAPRGSCEIIAGAAHMLPMTHAPQANATIEEFIEIHANNAK